ncbi:sigma-54 dependent transcriptional regulator [Microaerobacter geothermalis]|uniref:sigma-54-dependent transcriptional regulator n=1 Tax=Microaerobacter geothermalis TaxID=674972 RepID=UPI001F451581|nr:sigma-54 dependent transcriptional regulator [Microaerobacter geothermalis]MCF6095067.1 sigma-54 dependent transcriptional regulator [Microaerobacter geothermalis]
MDKRILIIDDEKTLRLSLSVGFSDEGYHVETASTAAEGYERIGRFSPHVIFLDLRLPDRSGLDLLDQVKQEYPAVTVVIMTAYGDTKSTVQAIKKGAFDYINKPFEWEEIYFITRKLFEHLSLQSEIEFYRREVRKQRTDKLIGNSVVMNRVKEHIKLLAGARDTTVLIEGETGTGKELAARSLHEWSERRERPFLAINCGAIPSNLLESELFGYERGAFTGAGREKQGLLEWANGGTVFLDEVGELSVEMQVKLLRFLEERKFKRIGGLHDISVDVRVVAATNRNLLQMVENGEFRSDLFYRLNVVPIHLPPLREREEDILLLAEYFLNDFSKQMGKDQLIFSSEAREILVAYDWPGNIRELRNVMERLVILHQGGVIQASDVVLNTAVKPDSRRSGQNISVYDTDNDSLFTNDFLLDQKVEEVERYYIDKALRLTKWNVSHAAKLLGISRYSLQRRIKKLYPAK